MSSSLAGFWVTLYGRIGVTPEDMGTVAESELVRIVEHLVWCTNCLRRLDFTEDYIDAMRRATIVEAFDRVIR